MGDLNDYSDNLLDRWSTKGYSTKQNQGKLLAELKKEKYVDIFRTIHPEQRVYSRIGTYTSRQSSVTHKKPKTKSTASTTKITNTRLDYFLTASKNLQLIDCCIILDNYDIGSDHRPILLSMEISKNIPHIASRKYTQTNPEEDNITMHSEPEIKLLKTKVMYRSGKLSNKIYRLTSHTMRY